MSLHPRFSSVRARLTLWNTLTFAFVLITLGITFRFFAQNYLLESLDHEIKKQAQRFQEQQSLATIFVTTSTQSSGSSALPSPAAISQLPQKGLPSFQDLLHIRGVHSVGAPIVQTYPTDASGQFLARSFDLEGKSTVFFPEAVSLSFPGLQETLRNALENVQQQPPGEETHPWDRAGFAAAVKGQESFADMDWKGAPIRVFSMPLRAEKIEPIGYKGGIENRVSRDPTAKIIGVMQIAAPLGQMQRDLAGLTHLLLLILPLTLLVAACAGIFLTGRMLRPVKALTLAATNLRADQLSQRLPIGGQDEFAELASTFNLALDRVEIAFGERERAMEQLRRFTADASHELRTPLTTIKANTGVALKETEPSEEHLHALRQIDRAADRMTSLVRDLLLLARAESAQNPSDLRALLAEEMVQDAIEALCHSPHAPIVVDASEKGIAVYGEAEPLRRLFLNLLQNAVRYTPVEGHIRITLTRQEQHACICVRDTGCGIAVTHLPHLGERFYRADSGRNREQGGAGLGLAICRSIVSRHQGTFAIESEIGQGTTVTICLPLAEEPFRNLSDLPATL